MVCSITGKRWFPWRDEGVILDTVMQRGRGTAAALRLLKKLPRNQPVEPESIVTDGLRSYKSALSELGLQHFHHPGRLRENNRAENSREPMREDAIFRIASMTKPIIAVAMLQLYEEGKWQLDDPVTKFIPEFADLKVMKDGQLVPLDRPILMRHVMTTCAGFAFGPTFGSVNPEVDALYMAADMWSGTNEDLIAKLAKLPLETQPGTHFRYGLQQEVQGVILQRLTGLSIDVLLEQRIFTPLGMKDTGFSVAPEHRDRIPPRYALDANFKLVLAADQSAFPTIAGTPPGVKPKLVIVDRRALRDCTGLSALCADAGERGRAGWGADTVAFVGQANDKQPAPTGRAHALPSIVRWRGLRDERRYRTRSIAC